MPSIDERIVAMSFENDKFEAAVAKTMGTLSKLDTAIRNIGSTNGLQNIEKSADRVTLQGPMSALDKLRGRLGNVGSGAAQGFSEIDRAGNKVTLGGVGTAIDRTQAKLGQLGAGATFTDIEKAADRTDLSGLSSALDNVSNKFSVLQGAASVALGNIASQAAMRGASFVKSFALGPAIQGFQEYGTNLGAIQTILANTQDSGGNLKTVNSALNELNRYSDKTIYNFTEMAKNIGTFTAAGVQLKPATESIKGIANLAALSGSNSQQASTAMYQLSQAIAAGRVGLQDWNSVVNAGMGGAVFQKALMRTAETMHTVKDGAVQIDKATGKATINGESFRESIQAKPGQQSWLTSDVLTKTLGQFTGDLKASDLAAQGFNASQIKAIQQTAKSAQNAATQVKTLPQVFDVARETIGSGWAQTFQNIFGNFGEAKKTFTDLSNTINGFINTSSRARNAVLGDWKAMGGRTILINGIKNAFSDLMALIKPIGQAFRDIFPRQTGQDLLNLTVGFTHLMGQLKIGPATADALRRTFAGFFAVLHIGWTIVKDVLGVVGNLLGVLGHSSGGILNLTGSIGDFLVSLDKAISSGGSLAAVFKGFSGVLQGPVDLIKALASAIGVLFGGSKKGSDQASVLSDNFNKLKQNASPLAAIFLAIVGALERLRGGLKKVANFLEPVFTDALNTVKNFSSNVVDALKTINFDDVTRGLTTAGIGGIFLALKQAIGGGVDINFFQGVRGQIVGTLNAVNGALGAMQKNIQANTLLQIGAAVAVLAAGIFVLSKIDPKALSKAMTAVAVGLGELVGALRLLGSAGGAASLAVMPLVGAALIELAIAVDLLVIAIEAFSRLSWQGLAKGLIGVGGALAAVAAGTKLIGPRIILIGPALIPLAIGMDLLAVAVRTLGGMSWENLAKGLSGMAIALSAINLAMRGMGPSIVLVGPGLIAASVGLILLSGAVASFGGMNLMQLGKGIVGIAAALVIIGVAMAAIPPTMALQAAGLVILGVALTEMGIALGIIGHMSIGTLAKGLVAIALALDIFAMGLTAMSGTLPGSVALLAAATGLAVLTPVLITLGNLDWGTILKGLAVMALSIGALAVVSTVAGPALVVLGVGLLALGVGLLAVSAAIYVAAKGISLLASAGQAGITALLLAFTGFVAMLPTIVINTVKGLIEIVSGIAKMAPQVAAAIGKLLDVLTTVIIENAPKIAVAAGVLIDSFLMIINDNAGNIIKTGIKLLETLLSGIANNISKVTHQAAMIITQFLAQLNNDGPRLIAQGAHVLLMFLNGIAVNLPRVMVAAANVALSFLNGIIINIPKFVGAGARAITGFLGALTDAVPRVIRSGVRLIISFIDGISSQFKPVADAATRTVVRFLNAVSSQENIAKMVDAGIKAVIHFLNGISEGLRRDQNIAKVIDAAYNIGEALVEGIVKGLVGLPKALAEKLIKPLDDAVGFVKKHLKIHSPSEVFAEIGTNIVAGMGIGLAGMSRTLEQHIARPLADMVARNHDAKALGQFLGKDFTDGLTGSQDSIVTAMDNFRGKLAEEQSKLADQVKADQDKLKKYMAEPGWKNPQMVAFLKGTLAQDQATLKAVKGASQQLLGQLSSEEMQLENLSAQYDQVGQKLQDAQSALADATRTRDDAIRSYTDQYSALPDINSEVVDQVGAYKKALQDQILATEKYMATLEKLRALGLDDTTYKRLLSEGTKDQTFADQLVRGGQAAVQDINKLDAKLLADSADLAKQAANNLYQAGVDAAQGLVDGLVAQQDAIHAQMTQIAQWMVDAIKTALGIQSPSKVMAEIGKFSAQGVISGLRGASGAVADAAASIGDDTAAAMSNSLARVADFVSSQIDMNPTITPVLDLTQVQKDATKLGDLTNVVPITAAASYGQASAISGEHQAAQDTQAAAEAAAVTQFTFEQNNYSPESLSDIEIYRQTNNQLSQAKRALGLAIG